MTIQVDVELARCTGCSHCKDVCPVAVFDLKPREIFTDLVDDALQNFVAHLASQGAVPYCRDEPGRDCCGIEPDRRLLWMATTQQSVGAGWCRVCDSRASSLDCRGVLGALIRVE